ncbi:MAG: ankyrin repeat domain-containing protein [Rickettsiales bacterium]|nr:ankyrin repeat domain-containing protein [Rickettsiales bacterium]
MDVTTSTWKHVEESISKQANEHKLEKNLSAGQEWLETDGLYELARECLCSFHSSTLTDSAQGSYTNNLSNLVHLWFVDKSDLTESQKKLNRELLSILNNYLILRYYSKDTEKVNCRFANHEKLEKFLQNNKNNQDLKTILNLRRGESGLTVLHVVSSLAITRKGVDLLLKAGADPNIKNDRGQTPLYYAITGFGGIVPLIEAGVDSDIQDDEGRTPLHYAASIGHTDYVNLLLEKKADPSIRDKQGKTPRQVAIDNGQYCVEKCFFTDNQKRLSEELYDIFDKRYEDNFDLTTKLKEFLSKHKSNQDLKAVLDVGLTDNLAFFDPGIKGLFLAAGAADLKKQNCDKEEHLLRSKDLWSNLMPNQLIKLNRFLDKVSKAQDISQLAKVVNEAIESGVRVNFPQRSPQSEGTYNFADCVVEKFNELKKNPKAAGDIEVASGIVCKLVSRGATFHSRSSRDVIDKLESEFKDHKANMKKAYVDYVNHAAKFVEVAKSSTNGRVKDARIDNSTFYLEYSEDSIINVAKITDGARSLGLTQRSIEYGRDIIKIGKSEVEIITENGIRNYTDLTDGSDIVLTFYTSLGELEVRLYTDMQNTNLIRVEINSQDLLKQLENRNEKIGKNCLLGGLPVSEAIKQGSFVRSGKSMCSEVISQSDRKQMDSWVVREELRRISGTGKEKITMLLNLP